MLIKESDRGGNEDKSDNPGMKTIICVNQHWLNADPDWPGGAIGRVGQRDPFQSARDPDLLPDLLREDAADGAEGIATATASASPLPLPVQLARAR